MTYYSDPQKPPRDLKFSGGSMRSLIVFNSVCTFSICFNLLFSIYFRAEKKERSRLKTVRVTRSQDRSVSSQENNVALVSTMLMKWFYRFKRIRSLLNFDKCQIFKVNGRKLINAQYTDKMLMTDHCFRHSHNIFSNRFWFHLIKNLF